MLACARLSAGRTPADTPADAEQEQVIAEGIAGEALDLAVGRYDIAASFAQSSDKPTRWLRGLDPGVGAMPRHAVDFDSGNLTVGAALRDETIAGPHDVPAEGHE